jgi:endonuclease/exonuclease/phosphatase family metal-dependent hydrolase
MHRSVSRQRVLPSVLAIACVATLCFASPAPIAAATGDLRVMSFNIRTANAANDGLDDWDGNRKNLVEQTIRNYGPDLVGFQEDLERQKNFLDNKFPAFEFVGRGVQGGNSGEFVSIMYRRNRFDELRRGHFWLSETPNKVGSESWGTALPRMVTWLELRDKQNPVTSFVIMNTHWDHVSSAARLESATLMREKINELAPGIPLIVTGDFNADQGGAAYQRMRGLDDFDTVRNLQDTYRNLHADAGSVGTAHGFDGRAGDGRIDWILHDNKFTTIDANIDRISFDGRYPSDHFPINAIVRPVIVPEPSGAAVICLAATAVFARRRRSPR